MKMTNPTQAPAKKSDEATLAITRIFLAAVMAVFLLQNAQAGEDPMGTEKATFAAGCFWGVEKVFSALPGVLSTQVGYTGGTLPSPTYEQVCTGRTGHAEAIEVNYDPAKTSYDDLLEVFFRHHDPTTLNRQGNDTGSQYRSAIFYHSPVQKEAAARVLGILAKSGVFKAPIVTTLEGASEFYRAEEYHQKYLKKNPGGYCHLLLQSGKIGQIIKEARAQK